MKLKDYGKKGGDEEVKGTEWSDQRLNFPGNPANQKQHTLCWPNAGKYSASPVMGDCYM